MPKRLLALFSYVALVLSPLLLSAAEPIYTARFSSVAIKGYDPVAYFLEEKPVKGSDRHTFEWKGAEWRFASAENRSRFAADPERWAPQYGGYCAWAVSQGYTAAIDPQAWTVVEDKLYLNYSKKVQEKWELDRDQNISKADANWPAVLE